MALPSAQQFKNAIAEFQDMDDDRVDSAMEQASLFVDPLIWSVTDYPWGIIFLAAHFLATQPGPPQGSIVVGGQTINMDELYASSVSFGDRRVSFARRSTVKGGALDPSTSIMAGGLNTTTYGSRYLTLRRRNVAPIAVI